MTHRLVAPVRRPAVVDEGPFEAGQHPELVGGGDTTVGVHAQEGEKGGAAHVEPPLGAGHANRGLVRPGDIFVRKGGGEVFDEAVEAVGCFGGERRQKAG
jgi:hypothetical protein